MNAAANEEIENMDIDEQASSLKNKANNEDEEKAKAKLKEDRKEEIVVVK